MYRRTRSRCAWIAGLATAIAISAAPASALGQGQVLYGSDGALGHFSDLLVIDPATGAVAGDEGQMHAAITGMAEDPTTGVLYGVTDQNDPIAPGELLTIDKSTGLATVVGDLVPPLDTTTFASDVTFTPDGTLYGWLEGPDDLATIDKSTGLATVVGNSGVSTARVGLAADGAGTIYLAVNTTSPLRTVDRNTGAVTAGPVINGTGTTSFTFGGAAFDASNTLFATIVNTVASGTSSGTLSTIDLTTGALSVRPETIIGFEGIEFVDRQARSIGLQAKKKVKRKKKVSLHGAITASVACAGAQAVTIERLEDGVFTAIATVTSAADGTYSFKQKVKEPTSFRASVSGPAFCADATSLTKEVKIKKERD
jgi:hypothetical protein